jgi:hypothetical protein
MKGASVIAWLPMVVLPAGVVYFTPSDWPRWAFMWLLAFVIFASCKWLTWWSAPCNCGVSWTRQLGYLVAWPGLDAAAFLQRSDFPRPAIGSWLFALGKFTFGAALLLLCVPNLPADQDDLRGWIGMLGILFVLHFGLFHLLSLGWQSTGVNAKPLMNWPILATSVSDFWGTRWNTAFRDLTHRFLFRPLTSRLGAKAALAIGFLVSGLVHDLVISLPAQGGFGGPTIYFLLQAGAVFFERSKLGQRLGLAHGVRGRAFAVLVLAGPIFLLFHPPFVSAVMVPFMNWLSQAMPSARATGGA